jgi:hypothetical protein
MRGGTVVLLPFLLVVPLGAARAACVDPSGIAPARVAIDAACPCAAAQSARAYRDCAKGVIAGRIDGGQLDASCATDVRRCVRGSTCGRPGMGTCCRMKRGKVQCQVTTPERCAARGGCVGVLGSCCDGCNGAGCTTTTTTTTLPGVCGNGVVDPGEQCDGQVFCVNCQLPIYACCDIAVSGGGVCSRDFYPEPGPPFCLDQGSVTHLGTVPANGPACPEAGFKIRGGRVQRADELPADHLLLHASGALHRDDRLRYPGPGQPVVEHQLLRAALRDPSLRRRYVWTGHAVSARMTPAA